MSINTELARLTNAKAAIKAAIEGKGVTVPDGTLLDGMASLIEGIEAGGSVEPFSKVLTGTHTPATNESSITFLPDESLKLRYFILQYNEYSSTVNLGTNIIKRISVYRGYAQVSKLLYGSNSHWSMPNYEERESNEELLVFPSSSNTTLYLGSGKTYNWIAVYTDI